MPSQTPRSSTGYKAKQPLGPAETRKQGRVTLPRQHRRRLSTRKAKGSGQDRHLAQGEGHDGERDTAGAARVRNPVGSRCVRTLGQEESRRPAREDVKPARPLQKGPESSPQPSCTRGREEAKKRPAGKCAENAGQKAGMRGASLSEVEEQQLRQREDYLKKKRDMLLATKKESRNNVLLPASTDQKEEESSPKEELSEEKQRLLQKRRMLAEKLKEEVIHRR